MIPTFQISVVVLDGGSAPLTVQVDAKNLLDALRRASLVPLDLWSGWDDEEPV